jgi:hypothetical protein
MMPLAMQTRFLWAAHCSVGAKGRAKQNDLTCALPEGSRVLYRHETGARRGVG